MLLLADLLVAYAAAETVAAPADARPIEIRALAGALVEVQTHGEADFGVRRGPWSAELYTDTLDLHWSPDFECGRGWVDVRAEGAVAGLMLTPWSGDAPAPGNALLASAIGPDAGLVRYLPGGFYVGTQASARIWLFGATPTTSVPVPSPHLIAGPAAYVGWWTPAGAVLASGGADLVDALGPEVTDPAWGAAGAVGAPVQPWLTLEAKWHPRWFVSPRLELRIGESQGKGAATAFRIGGGMPYGVPIVGYGWARLWAKDYEAGRVGVYVGSPDAAPGSGVGDEGVNRPADGKPRLRFGAVGDAVSWTAYATGATQVDAGVGLNGGLRVRRTWAQVEGGYGLLAGQPGLDAFTFMARVGLDWAPVHKKST